MASCLHNNKENEQDGTKELKFAFALVDKFLEVYFNF